MNEIPHRRPPARVIEAYRDLLKFDSVTCAVSDCMGRFGAMTPDMRPLFEPIRLVGAAVTVRTLASDLAAPFKAIDISEPDDIIVIDTHGSANTAFWGENMTLSAMNRGVAGALIDGCCRDVVEIRKLQFPVLCKGIVPNVASISGYGEVNVPIACAGVSVSPGDLIVVDENGVVVVPCELAEIVFEKTRRLLDDEHLLQDKIRSGATIGKLINVDAVMAGTFSYQQRALEKKS